MHARKRSASQAQLPTTVNHQHKRPTYNLSSHRDTQVILLDEVPEGHSLLNRWIALFTDTFRVLWEKSAEVASRVVPPNSDANLEVDLRRPITPEPSPHSSLPTHGAISHFGNASSLPFGAPPASTSGAFHRPPPMASNSTRDRPPRSSGSVNPDASDGVRHKYGKQTHIHMAQHKRKVQEHSARELERLRNRRSSISDDLDMEQTLKNAKRVLALKDGAQLAKQWEVEKAVGAFHSDLDSFTGFQTYRQMVLDESAGKLNLPSSPSLPNLRCSLSSGSRSRPRSSSSRRASFNLERTLQIAHQSLNEPRPPSPLSFDKLRLADLQKDREIEKRIREATRLPTKLPSHVLQEIKLLRTKRGVIARVGKEQVADGDLRRLDPGGTTHWLNDEIINFYGALILDRAEKYAASKENRVNGTMKKRKGKTEYLNVHYFSTFFWPKIEKSYKETRLNKWTKKFDIFQKDIVFVPVNHGNVHWTLAAINFRKKRIESYDSMGIYRDNVYNKLRYYIQEEHMDKKKKGFDFTGWSDHYDEDTPQQENGYDCGVFTCQFMESLSRGVDEFAFDQDDMPYIRDRMTWEIGKSRLWEDSDA